MNNELELKEQLAAIEHQRWSDWMEYMLDQGIKSGDDNIGIRTVGWPTGLFEGWQLQMDMAYEDLSPREQASDMEQVDRYWPLIEAFIARKQDEREREILERLECCDTEPINKVDAINVCYGGHLDRLEALSNHKEAKDE